VVTPSEHVRRQLIETWRLDPGRVRAIHLGVDAAFRRQPSDSPTRSGGPMMLFAGAPIQRKNLDLVIRAMRAARPGSLLGEAELLITGARDEQFPAHAASIAEAGLARRVRWLGRVSDDQMPRLYRTVDVLVYPSFDEGFGLPPLEAMACGTPVVASNAGALPETLGRAAVLVDPLDTEDFVNAVESVLSHRGTLDRLVDDGRAHSARFTWDRCAEETAQVFKLASRHPV
jgi:glycosyltransferase involved in cell wall biosynthesis